MREVGIDIATRLPKLLTREMQLDAELAVTMGCGDACPHVPGPVVDWDLPDPAGRSLEDVRAIRDLIEDRTRGLVAELLGARPGRR